MSVLFLHTDPEEMIYDDVELGEEGGCSSLDNGWSSSEFESYDEASDGEGHPENGVPHAFMRGKPPQRKTHVCRSSRSHFSANSPQYSTLCVCSWTEHFISHC